MKNLLRPALPALASLFLFSCGDSFEKLAKDQISLQDDITEVLNDVADGDLTSSEAAAKLGELVEKGKDISERKLALVKDLTGEEIEEIAKETRRKVLKANVEYSEALGNVVKSGKLTPELLNSLDTAISSASRNPDVEAMEAAGKQLLDEMSK